MKTILRFCLGLLLAISAVGCHTCQTSCQSSCEPGCDSGCGHRSCLHKVVDKFKRCNRCGSQGDCGCEHEATCDCGRHHRVRNRSKGKYQLPAEAAMYGYDNSVVYTGDDFQGIPQQAMGMMPMSVGCAGCAGGAPMMSMPSTGCAGCGGSGVSPIPSEGGCASCGGSGQAPQPAAGGCASCGGNHPTPAAAPSVPPTSGGCASCGASATNDSFYNPMGPGHNTPAPAPPAEGNPAPMPEGVPGNNATGSGDPIQKIHWVPRQL